MASRSAPEMGAPAASSQPLPHGIKDAMKGESLIRGISTGLTIELPHLHAPCMVQCDQIPLLDEHGTTRASSLGGRAVVNPRNFMIEQEVVIDGV